MKETVLSNSEKFFILEAISKEKRLDGRALNEFRDLKIHFGSDWGCCFVTLGETKVLAQVSCEVQQPKPTRPNEGLLLLFVELSPMGAPHFEAGRQSELGVQLNRLLEKCIKDSRCVDLESLCITAEEKVWAVRVDINVLNHDGNLVDAASVATLTSLAHFRRPDVTITGEETVIHNPAERDPIPITLHHHPVCVSYAIFNRGSNVLADPSAIEERVSEGQMIFGVNAYRELCGLHLGGNAQATTGLVLQYASCAAKRALEVVNYLKRALEEDLVIRNGGGTSSFKEYIESANLLSLKHESTQMEFDGDSLKETARSIIEDVSTDEDEEERPVVVPVGKGSAELLESSQKQSKRNGKLLKSKIDEDEKYEDDSFSSSNADSENDLDSEVEVVAELTKRDVARGKLIESIDLSSEEEETTVLLAEEINNCPKIGTSESRGWYAKKQW